MNGIIVKKKGGREVLWVGLQWAFLSEADRKMLQRAFKAGGCKQLPNTVMCASLAVATSVVEGLQEEK